MNSNFGIILIFTPLLLWLFIPLTIIQIFLLYLSAILIIYGLERPKEVCKRPPGPSGIYFGMLAIFEIFSTKDPMAGLVSLHEEHGPIVSIDFFGSRLIFINDYDAIKELSMHPELQLRPNIGMLMEMTKGLGLIGAEGELLKHQRRFILTALRSYGMGKMKLEEKIINELSSVVDFIRDTRGRPTSVFGVLEKSTSNVVFSLSFNKRFDYDDSDFIKRIKALDENFKIMGTMGIFSMIPFLKPFLRFILSKFYSNIKVLNEQAQEFIDDHKSTLDADNPRDLLDLYLLEMEKSFVDSDAIEYHKTFHTEQLKYLINDLFAGGTETSNTTIRWALLYMVHYPDIQKKVQKELDDVVGSERLPSMRDKPNLPFTVATLQEIERLGSVVPISLPRSNDKLVHWQNYDFPKRSTIGWNIYSVHRDPKLWKNPETFDPSRFIDEDGKSFRPPFLMPFGSGKRACPGEALARMEIFLYFTILVKSFHFECEKGKPKPLLTGERGATRSPTNYKICCYPRTN